MHERKADAPLPHQQHSGPVRRPAKQHRTTHNTQEKSDPSLRTRRGRRGSQSKPSKSETPNCRSDGFKKLRSFKDEFEGFQGKDERGEASKASKVKTKGLRRLQGEDEGEGGFEDFEGRTKGASKASKVRTKAASRTAGAWTVLGLALRQDPRTVDEVASSSFEPSKPSKAKGSKGRLFKLKHLSHWLIEGVGGKTITQCLFQKFLQPTKVQANPRITFLTSKSRTMQLNCATS